MKQKLITASAMFILAASAACSSPAPAEVEASPAPSESPSTEGPPTKAPTRTPVPPERFTSSRFGYSVTLPPGYKMTEVPGEWNGNRSDQTGDAGTDYYASPSALNPGQHGDLSVEIAVLPVDPGTTTEDWANSEADNTTLQTCEGGADLSESEVGGEPALAQHLKCDVYTYTNVFIVHGDQGYFISWIGYHAPPSKDFPAALASVEFP